MRGPAEVRAQGMRWWREGGATTSPWAEGVRTGRRGYEWDGESPASEPCQTTSFKAGMA